MLDVDFHAVGDAFFINVFNGRDFAQVDLAGVPFDTPVLVLLPSDAGSLASTRLLISQKDDQTYSVSLI